MRRMILFAVILATMAMAALPAAASTPPIMDRVGRSSW